MIYDSTRLHEKDLPLIFSGTSTRSFWSQRGDDLRARVLSKHINSCFLFLGNLFVDPSVGSR